VKGESDTFNTTNLIGFNKFL